ncbi:hypothetical protein AVEN_201116-1 [Araneus ventricosus]|uniref:Uncharacterized protein n=1 Tax=Araneus ventricosus TaxID=182803 RepID=A0A4Y2XB96_ARAVE|nr:hypothetical protein AVEN_26865-1 [Araneus ventricosus]GBO46439.1 hypothetical protein AVEN_201116-1 [Araneus ventricosus]
MEFSRTFERISFPNRDIEKRVAFSGIIYLPSRSPNLSPIRQNGRQVFRQGKESRNGRCPTLHAYPCTTTSPTIRLARQESDIASLQQCIPGAIRYIGANETLI